MIFIKHLETEKARSVTSPKETFFFLYEHAAACFIKLTQDDKCQDRKVSSRPKNSLELKRT